MSKDLSASLDLYRSMQRIRRVEEALIEAYHPANEMRCPIHFCVGQEAAPAALGMALGPDDVIYSHYRSHGYYMTKGASLEAMVAEFYGRQTGANGGVAGSMELADHEHHIYSGAIVGGMAGLAIGQAFAQKYLGESAITVAVFGDGAMDEGINYEAISLAVLKQLPVLFLCENNFYAAHAPVAVRTRAPSLTGRAAAFGIEAETIPDSDPDLLRTRVAAIVDGVRRNSRPFFLEIETYRFCGHVGPESDDAMAYRPLEEIQARKAADPLQALRRKLEASSAHNQLGAIDAKIEAEIVEVIAAARRAPFPDPAWAKTIVSADSYDPLVKELIEGAVGEFRGAQSESKLAPY